MEKQTKPLYFQVYESLVAEIREGHIKPNEKLPSKKQLCTRLGLSQTTIENAYEMLVTEGYITSVPRSGYYALDYTPLKSTAPISSGASCHSLTSQVNKYEYSLTTGNVDIDGFPFTQWARISKNVMYNEPELLSPGSSQGDLSLRETLIKYLHEFRGVNADSSQMIIGAGTEYLLSLLCRIQKENHLIAIENPCYMRVYRNLKDNGKQLIPISIDNDGLCLSELEQTAAKLVYITPSHQYPTGVTMPIGNRMRLLQWANEEPDRYIIEDDYDSEYRFSGRPIPSLQGLDQHGKVIYLGTFSRSLAPSIRIAYLILPSSLIDIYVNRFTYCASTVSRFEQHTLQQFLKDGHYTRHLNRTRTLYKHRKEYFVHLLKEKFRLGSYEIHGENLGLHFILEIRNDKTEQELIQLAASAGIQVIGLSSYYIDGNPEYPSLVIGYSGLSEQDMDDVVSRLKKVWDL